METSKDVLRVKLFVRRYREYKEIWEPKIGQEAMLMRESQNKWDSNAVTVVGGDLSDKMARKQEFLNHSNTPTSLTPDTKKWLGIFLS
ncbi:hypothetical protein P5673_025777 [Acropora cervicornis]|uniref:Uncharacterized protein n=1 Tax=Acropora cervicornis TaxID=6130 RepID=A0AAD9UX76_ACRCE|nr:hypothetical protein P5673_025777 [Acropora cervicornis]